MTDTAAPAEYAELRELLLRIRSENEADLVRARAALADLSANGLLVNPSMREESTSAQYLIDDASTIIGKVDAALARMDEGTFGVCTRCGNQIGIPRLRVRPYEPMCVSCSS